MDDFNLRNFLTENKLTEQSKILNETKFYVWYNKKKYEVEAPSLYKAKKKFIDDNNVPKSKQSKIAIKSAKSMKRGDFRFENKEFDLRNFLTENKLTETSKILNKNKQ